MAELGLRRSRKPVAVKAVRVRIPPPPQIMVKGTQFFPGRRIEQGPSPILEVLEKFYQDYIRRISNPPFAKGNFLIRGLEFLRNVKNLENLVELDEFLRTELRISGPPRQHSSSPFQEKTSSQNPKKKRQEGLRLGFLGEFLKTILSPFFLNEGYLIIRTSKEDDRETKVDEFIINIKKREVVAYLSDKVASSTGIELHYGITTPSQQVSFKRHPSITRGNMFEFKEYNDVVEIKNVYFSEDTLNQIAQNLVRTIKGSSVNTNFLNLLYNFVLDFVNRNRDQIGEWIKPEITLFSFEAYYKSLSQPK